MRKRLAVLGVILGVLFGAIGTTTMAVADDHGCVSSFDGPSHCDDGDDDYSDDGSSTDDSGGTRTYRPIPGGGGGRADASDVNDELAFTA